MIEDPNQHLKQFVQLCDTLKYVVIDDAFHLQLFPFSLYDNVYEWLDLQEPSSITTWDELAGKFLHKIFPISRTIQLRRVLDRRYALWHNEKVISMIFNHESMYEERVGLKST